MKCCYVFLIVVLSFMLAPAVARQTFWEPTNGPCQSDVNVLVINSHGDIFAGTDGYGIFRSTDNGNHWTKVTTGLSNPQVFALGINSKGEIFAGTWGSGIFCSADNGDSWKTANGDLPNPAYVYSIGITSRGHVFASLYDGDNPGVFRSKDNCESWTEIYKSTVSSLVISPSTFFDWFTGSTIVATKMGGGVIRSTDNGDSWTETLGNKPVILPNSSLSNNSLAIDSHGQIFVGTFKNGILRYTDDGKKWEAIGNGLMKCVNSLAINSKGYIFAGTEGNVITKTSYEFFFSPDNGHSWKEVTNGLPKGQINAIAINAKGGPLCCSRQCGFPKCEVNISMVGSLVNQEGDTAKIKW